MKKRLANILVAAMAMTVLAGCGNNAEDAALKDMDVDKYVTLAEYKGLEVSVPKSEVSDAEVQSLMQSVYDSSITAEAGITDRAAALGDTVNIDYEGKKDGVAFAGGTAQGSNLTLGSGQFIDGFEDGLVGVTPGETVDLNLTFPENYGSAELAGQAVVFTVTVNYILPTEITDEVVATMGIEGVTDVAGFEAHIREYLQASADYEYENSIKSYVLEAFMNSCTFEAVPEDMVAEYEQNARTNITNMANTYGVDVDTYTNYYYQADFETFVTSYAVEAVRQDMAFQAVANIENLNITDEELDTELQTLATDNGFDSVEELLGDATKEDYRVSLLYDKVLNYLVENAVVTN